MKVIPLDNESASPLYRQVMDRLQRDIAAGVYPPQSRIPSEAELCAAYQVSRVTVRKALAEMADAGLLERRQGKGTFVSAQRIHQNLRDVNSFHEACRMLGCIPGTQVVSAQEIPAPRASCDALMLPAAAEGTMMVELVRLRTADGQPVMLETNHFPAEYAWLLEEKLEGSLYALLEARGVVPTRGTHEISLCHATPTEAKILCVSAGDALLRLDQVIFDQQGRPLHTSHQVIRGDRFTFRI